MYVIRIQGFPDGRPDEADGRLVKEYRPVPGRLAPDGTPLVHLTTTDDPAQARQFRDQGEALEYWRQSFGMRPDGKPNRPLTAFTVSIEPISRRKQ